MSELTNYQLTALDGKSYADEIKARLRNDESWAAMVSPLLIDRTQLALQRIIQSIDAQKERIVNSGTAEPRWLTSIDALRRLLQSRLSEIEPTIEEPRTSANRETRAWRSFSARLAAVLEEDDHPALDAMKTPYGGLTAREWLAARDEKASA